MSVFSTGSTELNRLAKSFSESSLHFGVEFCAFVER